MKYKLPLLFLLLFPPSLIAQTAAQLEVVLESQAVTFSQAAVFVLEGEEGAFEKARSSGWIPPRASADSPITLSSLSFLIMSAYNMRGGLMYAMFPGPRYAYRSMVSRSFIQGPSDPSMTVNGQRFLLILERVLTAAGDGQ